jgi:ABC-type antimicrobial peptide transport system permease subunit
MRQRPYGTGMFGSLGATNRHFTTVLLVLFSIVALVLPLALLAVAALASLIPAARATRVSPMTALRGAA